MTREILILSCGRVGDLKQMQALAQALGWPYETRNLSTRRTLFGRRRKVTEESLAGLDGALPDLVLCAEAAAAEAARILKRRKGSQLKVVCLARPRGHFSDFDLIITTPQFELAQAPNILEIGLPITTGQSQQVAQSVSQEPRLALLVGGSSPPYRLDANFAHKLAADMKSHALAKRGVVMGTTSARTSPAAVEVLRQHLANGFSGFHFWRQGEANSYQQILAEADEFTVTADSVSMLADAIATGKPVSIYPIREEWSWDHRLIRSLWSLACQRQSPFAALLWPLFRSGLLEARPNRAALHRRLVESGTVTWFGDEPRPGNAEVLHRDTEIAVAGIKALFDPPVSTT